MVYLNDALGFSVEVLWAKPGLRDRLFGFEPLPREKRPQPDDQHVEATVQIDAPVAKVWEALRDHEAMSEWTGFDHVQLLRKGDADPAGVGAERLMSGSLGVVVEHVVGFEPEGELRYRAIEGAPFDYHRGEITVSEHGGGTEVRWRIGFRTRARGVCALMRVGLRRVLERGLKPHVEGLAAGC